MSKLASALRSVARLAAASALLAIPAASALAAAPTALSAAPLASPVAATVPIGPAGDAFYSPPAALTAGPQGSVVWARPSTAFTTPAGAVRATTVIYRSRAVDGSAHVVSGDVLIPAGDAPDGGWPIVAWQHVTTGGADLCAPTRATPTQTDGGRMLRSRATVSQLLARGIAVVRTDYEGLGTPGRHPYLMGESLAQATVDMVRAGRDLEPSLSSRYVAAGHSEGGVASLFTGALAGQLAPELELRGVSAVAPVMSMGPLFDLGRHLPFAGGEITALAGLILDGAGAVDPTLDTMYGAGGLSGAALVLRPHVQARCFDGLTAKDSWGGIAPNKIMGPQGDAAYARVKAVLAVNEPNDLRFPRGLPVRIDQGDLDPVTWRPFADRYVRALRRVGTDVTYRTYFFGTHANITDGGYAAAPVARWAAARLR